MKLAGWGKYSTTDAQLVHPLDTEGVLKTITDHSCTSLIARGFGRSYGDSALASHVLSTTYLDHFLSFDETSGVLTCSAGVTFADIVSVFVPKGWSSNPALLTLP